MVSIHTKYGYVKIFSNHGSQITLQLNVKGDHKTLGLICTHKSHTQWLQLVDMAPGTPMARLPWWRSTLHIALPKIYTNNMHGWHQTCHLNQQETAVNTQAPMPYTLWRDPFNILWPNQRNSATPERYQEIHTHHSHTTGSRWQKWHQSHQTTPYATTCWPWH